MSGIGKLFGVDQDKTIAALAESVEEQFGPMTLAEFADKYGDTHQLKLSVTEGKVSLEKKP